jgi:hypothetical protein
VLRQFGSVLISKARAFDRKGREEFAKFAKETQSKLGHYWQFIVHVRKKRIQVTSFYVTFVRLAMYGRFIFRAAVHFWAGPAENKGFTTGNSLRVSGVYVE